MATSSRAAGSASHHRRKRRLLTALCIDDFDVGQLIGRGGFATVYRARHRRSGKVCALKIMEKESIARHRMEDRVAQEIRIHAGLRCDGIVRLHGHFEDADHVYLVLELCEGGNLYRLLKLHGPLREREAAKLIKQLLQALLYMHGRGVRNAATNATPTYDVSPAETVSFLWFSPAGGSPGPEAVQRAPRPSAPAPAARPAPPPRAPLGLGRHRGQVPADGALRRLAAAHRTFVVLAGFLFLFLVVVADDRQGVPFLPACDTWARLPSPPSLPLFCVSVAVRLRPGGAGGAPGRGALHAVRHPQLHRPGGTVITSSIPQHTALSFTSMHSRLGPSSPNEPFLVSHFICVLCVSDM